SSCFTLLLCSTNFSAIYLASSCPRPIPAHECNVHPSILTEAIPVVAVTAN
ncbi:hypothetical protein DAEQUDRAFT_644800, partial [Daedalea quercina L-15889]